MAFTVNDLQDLLKLLREHPEWRAEVRKEVLGDELLALPDLVRQNSEDIQKLTERLDRLTANVDRLVEEMREVSWSSPRRLPTPAPRHAPGHAG